jgi:hypothetical protein
LTLHEANVIDDFEEVTLLEIINKIVKIELG